MWTNQVLPGESKDIESCVSKTYNHAKKGIFRRYFLSVTAACIAFAIILSAILWPGPNRKQNGFDAIDEPVDSGTGRTQNDAVLANRYLLQLRYKLFGPDSVMFEPDSPELFATSLMAFNDQPRVDIKDERLLQRYAMLATSLAWDLPTDGHECSWTHSVCRDGIIVELNLNEYGVTGKLPSQLSFLSQLERFDLSKNRVEGSLPKWLFEMTSLVHLNLHHNEFKFSIPSVIGNLTNLEYLDLAYNSFTGTVPTSIDQLTKLRSLGVYQNDIIGHLLDSVVALSSLTSLQAFMTSISGTIPPEIWRLSNLQHFLVHSSFLDGQIPTEIGVMTTLENLSLHSCLLTGSFPSEIGALTALSLLSVFSLSFSDTTLPTSIGRLSNLEALSVSGCSFVGTIPSEIGSLDKLVDLRLHNNYFMGTIPVEIRNCPLLSSFHIYNNPHLDSTGGLNISADLCPRLGSATAPCQFDCSCCSKRASGHDTCRNGPS